MKNKKKINLEITTVLHVGYDNSTNVTTQNTILKHENGHAQENVLSTSVVSLKWRRCTFGFAQWIHFSRERMK